MTPEEKHLWYDFLKHLPYNVKRQKMIDNYIVDFYIAEKRLVVELDGLQHHQPKNREYDTVRDHRLSMMGYTVVRYDNEQIRDHFFSVCTDLMKILGISADDLI